MPPPEDPRELVSPRLCSGRSGRTRYVTCDLSSVGNKARVEVSTAGDSSVLTRTRKRHQRKLLVFSAVRVQAGHRACPSSRPVPCPASVPRAGRGVRLSGTEKCQAQGLPPLRSAREEPAQHEGEPQAVAGTLGPGSGAVGGRWGRRSFSGRLCGNPVFPVQTPRGRAVLSLLDHS